MLCSMSRGYVATEYLCVSSFRKFRRRGVVFKPDPSDETAIDEKNDQKWGIYLTQVYPIYCGWRRQPWRSTSPSTCTAPVPPLRLARRGARRAFLGYASFVD